MPDGRVEIEVTANASQVSNEMRSADTAVRQAASSASQAAETISRSAQNITQSAGGMSAEMASAFEAAADSAGEASGSVAELTQVFSRFAERAEAQANGIAASLETIADAFRESEPPADESGEKMQYVMGNLVASAIMFCIQKLQELGSYVFDTGVKFESAFAGVKKTVDFDESVISAGEMRQALKDIAANEIPETFEGLSAIAESAGQLGIKTDDILNFTKVMAEMGTATNLSSEEAASSLAKFANITGMSADNYENLGSAVVALGNTFATTESDIVGMSMRLASAGTAAKLSETDILGLSAAMSSVGIEAEAGGSSMSTFIKRMQTAVETGDGLEDFADVAGMSAAEFTNAWKSDPITAITAFITGLGKMEEKGTSAVAVLNEMGLDDIRLSNTLLSLSGASDLLVDAVSSANTAWEENTALANEAEQRYATTESQLTMTANAAANLADSLFQSTDGISEVIGSIKGYLIELTEAADEGGFEGFAESLGTVLADALANAAEMLPEVTEVAVSVIDNFVGGIAENAGNITQAAADIVVSLAGSLTEALPTLIPAAVDAVMCIVTTVIENVGLIADAAVELVTALAEGLITALPVLVMRLPEFIISLGMAIIGLIPMLLDIPRKIGEAIGDGLVNFEWKETAEQVFDNMLERLKEQTVRVRQVFADFFRGLGFDAAAEFFEGAESGAEEYTTAHQTNDGEAGDGGRSSGRNDRKSGEPAKEEPVENIEAGAGENLEAEVQRVNKVTDEFKAAYDNLKMAVINGDVSEGEEYFSELEKLLDEHNAKGLSAYNKYFSEVKDGRQKLADEIAKEEKKRTDEIAKAEKERIKQVQSAAKAEISEAKKSVSEIVKLYKSQMKEAEKLIDGYRKKLLSVGDAFSVSEDTDKFGNKLTANKIADFDAQIKAMEDYDSKIRKLKEQGADDGFISELMSSNDIKDGSKFADYISKLSEAERQKVFDGYKAREEAAQRLAENMYSDKVSEIEENFISEIEGAFGDLPEGMRELGASAVEQFIEGFSDADIIGGISEKANEIFSALSDAAENGVFNSLDNLLSADDGYYDELAARVEAIVEAQSAAVSSAVSAKAVVISAEGTAASAGSQSYSKAEIDRLISELKKPVVLQLDGKAIAEFTIGYANRQSRITGGAVIK